MADLVTKTPHPWPGPFDWLGHPVDQLRLHILERSRLDVGILEVPEASNRGERIDTYLRRAFVPESLIAAGKGYWCAAAVGAWFIDGGAKVPKDYASCDAWLPFLVACELRTLATVAKPGDAVLYGKIFPNGTMDAHHIGLVWRTAPTLLSCEGNRGLAGTPTNNGVAVDVHTITRPDVLGIVRPVAR